MGKMSSYRVYVEKKENFRTEQVALKKELYDILGIQLKSIRILNIYDVFNISETLLSKAKEQVLSERVSDYTYQKFDFNNSKYFAIEYLPGQFDQRAE